MLARIDIQQRTMDLTRHQAAEGDGTIGVVVGPNK